MRSDRDLLEKSGVRWRTGVTISRARSTSARVTEIGVLHGGPARDRTWDQQIMSPRGRVRRGPGAFALRRIVRECVRVRPSESGRVHRLGYALATETPWGYG